jgi:hypothetical protein
MATCFVVITVHPPQLCQTSNKKSAELYKAAAPALHGVEGNRVKVLIGPLITSDHQSFMVVEAEDYEDLRKWTVASRLIQWNSVTTLTVVNYDRAGAELGEVEFVW